MNTFLTDLALAHRQHEGWYPGSISYRLNNPGNLRYIYSHTLYYGAIRDNSGFSRFPTYTIGLRALCNDLKAKITGHSVFINYDRNPTFLTYVQVYAPTDDGNDPNGYCQSLCRSLAKYNVKPSTPLSQLAQLIAQTIDRIPDPPQEDPQPSLQQRLQDAENALPHASGPRANLLNRLIARIKKILSIP